MIRQLFRLTVIAVCIFGVAFSFLVAPRAASASTNNVTLCVVSISVSNGIVTEVIKASGTGTDLYYDVDAWFGSPSNEYYDAEFGSLPGYPSVWTPGQTYTLKDYAPPGYSTYGVEIDDTALQVGGCIDIYGTTGYACAVTEGSYQDVLTADTQLFWAADPTKSVTPVTVIPAGKVVSVIDNKTPGWLYISWACANYYIKAGAQAPNTAAVSKPFLKGN